VADALFSRRPCAAEVPKQMKTVSKGHKKCRTVLVRTLVFLAAEVPKQTKIASKGHKKCRTVPVMPVFLLEPACHRRAPCLSAAHTGSTWVDSCHLPLVER